MGKVLELDYKFLVWMQLHGHSRSMDFLMHRLGNGWFWVPLAMMVIAYVAASGSRRFNFWLFILVPALLLTHQSLRLLAVLFHRLPPCADPISQPYVTISQCDYSFSFPDMFMGLAATFVTYFYFFFSRYFARNYFIWFIPLLVVILLARVYSATGFPLDMVLGAGIGWIIGMIMVRFTLHFYPVFFPD